MRLRDLPALTPWLLRFVASARPERVEAAAEALSWLMSTALADHQELARRSGMSGHMRKTGALYITASESGYRAAKEEWDERVRHGVPMQELTAAEARKLVPALTGKFSTRLLRPRIVDRHQSRSPSSRRSAAGSATPMPSSSRR